MTLIERLRQVVGETTRYYVNPDGPKAADEIERLREALMRIENLDYCTIDCGISNQATKIARAALKGDE